MYLAGGAAVAVAALFFMLLLEFFGLVEPRLFSLFSDKSLVVVPFLGLAGYQAARAFLEIRREGIEEKTRLRPSEEQ